MAVWDLQTGAWLHELTGHHGEVTSVALSGDGRHIVSGSDDGTVAVCDLQTGARLHELTGHHGGVSSVALSGDGRHIVSGSSDRTVAVWDLQTGARLATLALDVGIVCLARHSADRVLVVGDMIGDLYCLEYRQGGLQDTPEPSNGPPPSGGTTTVGQREGLSPDHRPCNLPFTTLGTLFKGRQEFLADLRRNLVREDRRPWRCMGWGAWARPGQHRVRLEA